VNARNFYIMKTVLSCILMSVLSRYWNDETVVDFIPAPSRDCELMNYETAFFRSKNACNSSSVSFFTLEIWHLFHKLVECITIGHIPRPLM
jgi:hypothetical protein